jgi:hypothetical protein
MAVVKLKEIDFDHAASLVLQFGNWATSGCPIGFGKY